MSTDQTIKVSEEAREWLVERKEKTGVPIKFTIDQAIEALKEKENKKK